MFKLLVLLSVCVVLAAGASPPKSAELDIRVYTYHKSQAIMTGINNYGITHESFHEHGFLTASVNGDKVTWVSNQCEKTTTAGGADKALNDAISVMGMDAINVMYIGRDNKQSQYMVGNAGDMTTFGSAGVSEKITADFAKIFINANYITFVYNDGRVEMKPIKCLNDAETLALKQMNQEWANFRSRF